MIRFDNIPKIFIATGPTDPRKGIDGYALIIQDEHKLSPFEDVLFIFCNRHHNKIKCLYWDGTGFWLLYKRLDKGNFKWEKKWTDRDITSAAWIASPGTQNNAEKLSGTIFSQVYLGPRFFLKLRLFLLKNGII